MASNDGMHIFLDAVKDEGSELTLVKHFARAIIKEIELNKQAEAEGKKRDINTSQIEEFMKEKMKEIVYTDEKKTGEKEPFVLNFQHAH